MMLTSAQNPRIKAIRALSQRKKRRETGLFFAEGIRLVGEAVQTGADLETIVVAPKLLRSDFGRDTVQRAEQDGVEVLYVSADVFHSLSRKDGPQGLGAVVRQRWTALDDVGRDDEGGYDAGLGPDDVSRDEVGRDEVGRADSTVNDSLGWVVLEDVGNPGNLGSILRTCEAVGASGVILLGDTADPYDPASVRGSMGSIFTRRVVRTSLESLIHWRNKTDLPMVGASDAATVDYREAAYAPPVLLCLGGEQHGLSDELMDACDQVVRIPMVGRADSLNLAVAAGVMLYDVFNWARGAD